MPDHYSNEPLLDMFVFETTQLLEQLEELVLSNEKSSHYSQPAVDEIFRIMHTVKGSSAMMMFDNISLLTHVIEDIFYFIRRDKPVDMDCPALSDLIFEAIDFVKNEIEKIKKGIVPDGDAAVLIDKAKGFLSRLKGNTKNPEPTDTETGSSVPKNAYKVVLRFEEGCQMENIRAYSIVHNLKNISADIIFFPEDIVENEESADLIRKDGFKIYLKSDRTYKELRDFFMKTIFLRDLDLSQLENDSETAWLAELRQVTAEQSSEAQPGNRPDKDEKDSDSKDIHNTPSQQNIISVSVSKLDKLMDLVGEMVIAEAMVIQNPDLKGLQLDNFQKSARHLNKITSEIQDMVMSVRMVPLSVTLHKMHRIVRDMCRKLGKEAELEIIGEETEVDKNIIEHISDPLMHLVRNSLDHGIEPYEDRLAKGKPKAGTITLEAKNAGSDVLIIVKDDGKGLNKEEILGKAAENGLLQKPANEMTDREIYNLIFLPGLSTKENVTEFSGRGVGMDVVSKNIEMIGGSVSVESAPDQGTSIILKIPLTLAIIDGMNIKVGNSRYTIPTISIKESFKPKSDDIITDPEGNEMIMVRGNCYPILRIHEFYRVRTDITHFDEGIIIMVEQDEKSLCIFADALLGQQQVVVKTLPNYIREFHKIKGLTGCTLLGDGSISLILDIGGMMAR